MNSTIDRKVEKQERSSNFELLRIISMLLVLIVHTDFRSLGIPSDVDMQSAPLTSFVRYLVESLSIVCVNCFVFITGWFGIIPTWKRLWKLLFQLIFFSSLISAFYYLCGFEPFSVKSLIKHSNVFSMWFVATYIGLFAFAPLLNAFVKVSTERDFRHFLFAFGILQLFLGWGKDYLHFFNGYSLLSFIFIYLLAKYIKFYGGWVFSFRKEYDILLFFFLSLASALIAWLSFYLDTRLWNRIDKLYFYNAPNVLLAGIFLCLYFSKLTIKSKAINWVASSAFAVYLFHCDPFVLIDFIARVKELFMKNSLMAFSVKILIFISIVFIIAILLDKIRIWLWNKIVNNNKYLKSLK